MIQLIPFDRIVDAIKSSYFQQPFVTVEGDLFTVNFIHDNNKYYSTSSADNLDHKIPYKLIAYEIYFWKETDGISDGWYQGSLTSTFNRIIATSDTKDELIDFAYSVKGYYENKQNVIKKAEEDFLMAIQMLA